MKPSKFFSLQQSNRKKILRIIYENASTTRMEIVRRANLSKVTVSRFISQFIKEGLILESGRDVSYGGRCPTLIKLRPEAKLIIAIDVGLESVKFGLCDLRLNVKESAEKKFAVPVSSACFESLINEGLEWLKKTESFRENKVLGMGISLPGVIDTKRGKVIQSFLLKDKEVELKRGLVKNFKTDVFIDKDANAGLYYEKWLGIGKDYDNILYIYTRNYEKGQIGVGASFYFNGKIYHGATYCSGEVGLAPRKKEKEEIFGPFSSYETGPSLERLVKSMPLEEGGILSELVRKNELNFASIIEAARRKDAQAEMILETVGAKIGRGAAFLINLINPQLVIIGGDFAEAPQEFHRSLKKAVIDYGFEFSTENLKIETASKAAELSGIRQAAFLVVGSLLGL